MNVTTLERTRTQRITISERAASHIARHLKKRGHGIGMRLGITTTGCSGLAYKMEYVDEPRAEDLLFEQHGVKVYVDPESMQYIDGTQIDYTREGLNEGFRFVNPNEKASCGCGESFTV
ncbi:iron-sulfur cluster assembly protein IscA [Yanghanlia caeni]|uniref:Iron-binding protein IscA n=1 Tax=Yanghanlia caeni TaxID=3064283 RepID=A0ABU1D812_9BURK|nr:iron-sulfur cluster assembly protein IscA [Alcaligenaceae bacterium LG-2]NGR08803.1 iron-sulfur cluster assembly protein IscA [bacterium SGD-2]HZH57902.1 iron-sulfur cluster assembly protein IscA [Burkholderiaceae bacterium]